MDCNDFDENTWGRALLCPNRHGGDNQLWKIEDGELICQHEGARLEIFICTAKIYIIKETYVSYTYKFFDPSCGV